MEPHKLTILAAISFVLTLNTPNISGQKQKAPPGGRIAVVVDERLSALRETPDLRGKLVRRLGRGRLVAVKSVKTGRDGIVFYLVNVSRRTHGWIQREAVVSASRAGDDVKLFTLIENSADFDRIVRARIFLNHFQHSRLRPEVLIILGAAAEQVSEKLSVEAVRRLSYNTNALEFSYFLNYTGLDRYNRLDVGFIFDRVEKRFHYDGAAWYEILRRFPRTPQAIEARRRLTQVALRYLNRHT